MFNLWPNAIFANHALKDFHPLYYKPSMATSTQNCQQESLLRQDPQSVRVIGIWGIGGPGKTTIAEQVYNLLRDEFEAEAAVFLQNLKRGITKPLGEDPKIDMQNGLPTYVEKRIGRMKVLIVLDDVSESE
ncbi:hypothetical protein PIB30_006276 [Stylosanthes scabra]|uniref:NB-ARC domain-containing protein n=1 Tax=Stylosanthes scabra TaxID=79078 RepID=A0ABU6Q484_9FABA|nr:hypothetical protein [Stylosanthes scabra]